MISPRCKASIVYLILLCNVFALVDINLEEDHIVHGLVHLLQVWGNHLAGSAPGCVEVDHHELAASSLQLVEVQRIRIVGLIGDERLILTRLKGKEQG